MKKKNLFFTFLAITALVVTIALPQAQAAENKKKAIKILGFLYQDGLDIKEIYHDGISVRPDVFTRRGYYLGW